MNNDLNPGLFLRFILLHSDGILKFITDQVKYLLPVVFNNMASMESKVGYVVVEQHLIGGKILSLLMVH